MTPTAAAPRTRGTFTPNGFKKRFEALTFLVQFGPGLLPIPEFLMLLYHAERALTYGKRADATSYDQMAHGVWSKKASRWIRGPAGVNKGTAAAANARLEKWSLLKRRQMDSARRGHQATEYEVQWEKFTELLKKQGSGTPLVRITDKALSATRTSLVRVAEQQRVNHHQRELKQSLGGSPKSARGSVAAAEKQNSFPQRTDDEKPKSKTSSEGKSTATPGGLSASPVDELEDIYRTKVGVAISPDLERRIWETVELRGVSRLFFMEQLRPHVANVWKNPAGFLTNFARKIGSVATPEPEPVEAREPEALEPPKNENGRCSMCSGCGFILRHVEGQERPQASDLYCDCRFGRELERCDRLHNGAPKVPKPELTAMPATGGLQ